MYNLLQNTVINDTFFIGLTSFDMTIESMQLILREKLKFNFAILIDFLQIALASSIFKLQKCYLHQNGVEFCQELNGTV